MYHMEDLMEDKLLYKERLERRVSSALDTGRVWAMLGLVEEPECGDTDGRGLSHLCFGLCPSGGDCISDLTESLSVGFAEMCVLFACF